MKRERASSDDRKVPAASRISPAGGIEVPPGTDPDFAALAAQTDDPDVKRSLMILADPKTEWFDAADVLRECSMRQLASARKAKGITQKELGEKLGVPQSRVSTIERHPERVSADMLAKIARVLGVRVFITG